MTVSEKSYRGAWLATAGGFVAILLWSTTIAVGRSLSESVGPITSAATIFAVSGAMAVGRICISSRRRRNLRHLPKKYLFGCGLLFILDMLMLYLAIGWSSSREQLLEVGLLNYLWPILTLLFSLAILGRKTRLLLVPGTVLALAGMFLVLSQGSEISLPSFIRNLASNPAAYSLAFGTAVFWAMYSVLAGKWAGAKGSGGTDIFLPATAAVLLVICLLVDEPRAWNAKSVAETACMGVATYIAYGLWDKAMRAGNVVLVAAGSYLTPLFSTLFSCLYLSVIPKPTLWAGCAILVAGSLLSWLSVPDPPAVKSLSPAVADNDSG